jgi:hypothetical protein
LTSRGELTILNRERPATAEARLRGSGVGLVVEDVEEALANVKDALAAVIETYEDLGRRLPQNVLIPDASGPVWLETLVTAR